MKNYEHPEHCWKWTETELRWIAARDKEAADLIDKMRTALLCCLDGLEEGHWQETRRFALEAVKAANEYKAGK